MKVIVTEQSGVEHEIQREPPFTNVWAYIDGSSTRYFVASGWRDYTYPTFTEVSITYFDLNTK